MRHEGTIIPHPEQAAVVRRIFTEALAGSGTEKIAEGLNAEFAPAHEYAIFFGKTEDSIPHGLEKTEQALTRFPKEDAKGRYAWANLIIGNGDRREDRAT